MKLLAILSLTLAGMCVGQQAKPVIKKCSGLTGECKVESTEPAGNPAKKVVTLSTAKNPPDGTVWCDKTKTTICDGGGFVYYPPEPVDVPAIQETREAPYPCNLSHSAQLNCLTGPEKYWTCADKRRILENDEQNPPVYYCRKPQL